MAARIRAWLGREDGMTLIELLTTMAILGFVMTGVLAMFVGGLHATTDMNERFQAQQDARLALTTMRNDIRTACTAPTVGGNGASVMLSYCDATTGAVTKYVTWCSDSASHVAPFGLYRQEGQVCAASTGVRKANSLKCAGTSATCPTPVFTYTSVSNTRPQLQVYLPVDANLSNSTGLYTLSDVVTLRNAPIS